MAQVNGGGRQLPPRTPVFNAPRVIVVLLAVMAGAYLLVQVLPEDLQIWTLVHFAFIPARFSYWSELPAILANGHIAVLLAAAQDVLTLASHTLLHADLLHVTLNGAWLLAIGTIVARRTGTARFLALFVAGAAAGALLHLALNWGSAVPMVGASGAVSAAFGAAGRFIFAAPPVPGSTALNRVPLLPLRDRRVVAFVLVFVLINLLVALFGSGLAGEGGLVAWDAHIGGFMLGLLLFPLFDAPLRSRIGSDGPGAPPPYLRRVQ